VQRSNCSAIGQTMSDQPRFQTAEPVQAQGQPSNGNHQGPFHSIRQLMSARRAFHKRIEEVKANHAAQANGNGISMPSSVAARDGNGGGGQSLGPAPPAAVTNAPTPSHITDDTQHHRALGVPLAPEGQRQRRGSSEITLSVTSNGYTTPIDSADDSSAIESSLQHDTGAESSADSLCVWKVNLFLRDEATEGIEHVSGVAPFDQRFGRDQPVTVTVVIRFNASNPDVEAPMIRILAPRIAGPSLFHGVVCANDLANGEWSLRRAFDVLLALRTHLIQHCAIETGQRGGAFSDLEARDGATYIATLHPEWKLQSDVAPEYLAKARELVEAAAANSNQAAYLAQELQQRELQFTRHLALERRPHLHKPPTAVPENNLYDEETEAMVRHLRELALQRLDEAYAIASTGETLQRRACALFALGRYEEAYDGFNEVRHRYSQINGGGAAPAAGRANGGGPNDDDAACSSVCYELAHCSLKLGLPRRAFQEALMGVRHSPPGPFATVLHSIATAVAKEEEQALTDVVLAARVAANKAGFEGGHHTHHPSAASSSATDLSRGPTGDASLNGPAAIHRRHHHAAKRAREAQVDMEQASQAVGRCGRDAFTVLQQLLELSPHNPRVLGAMAFALAIAGDASQASRCLDVATGAAGLDPLGMAILEPPALTPSMQKVWAEHRAMVAGWLQTSLLIGQITAAEAAKRIAEGLPIADLEAYERERRDRIVPLASPAANEYDQHCHDNRMLEDAQVDQSDDTLQSDHVRRGPRWAHGSFPESDDHGKAINAAIAGHAFALSAAVRDIFSAMDAMALVNGAGRCEFAEAAQALQLTGFLNQYGPPPLLGSLIDLGHFHTSDIDQIIAGRRTILPQHIDSLLERDTVEQLRGEHLGPALALELRDRTITDLIPYQPQKKFDSAEFRRLIAMAPAWSRQQYYNQVRAIVLNKLVGRLQPTLVAIAKDKLTLDRQLMVWAVTEGGGDLVAASEMMDRGLRDYLRESRRHDDLNLDGPRWHRRRMSPQAGLSRHTIRPSRRALEPFYDMRVILLIANRVANGGNLDAAQALLFEAASRLAVSGPSSCPKELPCGRCQARSAVESQLRMLARCADDAHVMEAWRNDVPAAAKAEHRDSAKVLPETQADSRPEKDRGIQTRDSEVELHADASANGDRPRRGNSSTGSSGHAPEMPEDGKVSSTSSAGVPKPNRSGSLDKDSSGGRNGRSRRPKSPERG
jgi:tetratricopeptide (TPR) repeat protein